jgi:hypothetical protein
MADTNDIGATNGTFCSLVKRKKLTDFEFIKLFHDV